MKKENISKKWKNMLSILKNKIPKKRNFRSPVHKPTRSFMNKQTRFRKNGIQRRNLTIDDSFIKGLSSKKHNTLEYKKHNKRNSVLNKDLLNGLINSLGKTKDRYEGRMKKSFNSDRENYNSTVALISQKS